MAGQNEINPVTPFSGFVVTTSEIIAPVASSIANGLIYLSGKVTEYLNRDHAMSAPAPAPHVSLVVTPGNFVTDAFTRR